MRAGGHKTRFPPLSFLSFVGVQRSSVVEALAASWFLAQFLERHLPLALLLDGRRLTLGATRLTFRTAAAAAAHL